MSATAEQRMKLKPAEALDLKSTSVTLNVLLKYFFFLTDKENSIQLIPLLIIPL